ncbi:MAG: TRAP transporter small permease [Alphaproteobacteria bacterium]|nr:TRAP transporter small permease [Alphaproteobacteria bacterium]
MKNAFATLEEWLGHLARLLAVISSVSLVALALVTGVSVIWRYVLRDPIFGIEDVSTVLLAVTVAGAISYGGISGSHVNVNLIGFFVKRRVTRFSDAFVRLLGAAISGFASVALFVKGGCGVPCGDFTPNMAILHQPFYYLLGVALGIYSAVLLVQLAQGLAHFSDPDDPNPFTD